MKEGWEYKKLGEIATEMYRGSGIKRDQVTKEGTPCVRYGEIYTTYNISFDTCASHTKIENVTSPKYFEYGDLLFAITGESVEDIGKTIAYLGDEKCLCGGDIICMKHHQNPKYLAYALSTPDAIRQKGIGKTKLKVVHTNASALKAINIPLAPLSEQQSIVDYLDSAFAKIDAMKANAEKALNEAKALFQASLKEMLEPKEGWEEKKLLSLTSKIGSGATPKGGRKVYIEKGCHLIRSMNIQYNEFKYEDLAHITDEAANQLNGVEIQEDDVLFNITGASIARCCVVPADVLPARVNQHVSILRLKQEVLPRFLSYIMNSPNHQKRLLEIGETGSTRQALTKTDLENHTICYPTIECQNKIICALNSLKSKVDKLQANYDRISQECDVLKQAILRQVFE